MRHFLHTISGFILAALMLTFTVTMLVGNEPDLTITGEPEHQTKTVVAIVLVLSAGAIFIGSKDNSLYD